MIDSVKVHFTLCVIFLGCGNNSLTPYFQRSKTCQGRLNVPAPLRAGTQPEMTRAVRTDCCALGAWIDTRTLSAQVETPCFSALFPSFFTFPEKSCVKILPLIKKVVPLHSLSGSNRGGISGCVFMLASWNGEKDGSLTDCEQNKTSSARTYGYIYVYVHVCAQAQVIPL